MCGRARLSTDYSETRIKLKFDPDYPAPNIPASWNVCPMAAAIRAAELLGKSIGMFDDHPEVDPAIDEFKNLSVEQMRERIAQLVDEMGMPDVAERYRVRTRSAPAKH
jgi:hypothetical protein